ncbi:MAG: hypothetical protein EBU54_11515 [Mycobacteriaceae bacterium]|nr:hypothetical protein [Mycobacteriaceae bacterium]
MQWQPDDAQTLLSSGVVRFDPPPGLFPPEQRRKNQIAVTGLLAPTQQLDGTLLSSSFPELRDPAVAVDIYRGDAGLDTGRPQSLFALDHRLIEQKRLTKVKRINLALGEEVRLDDGTVVRFDGATPFVNIQVSRSPRRSSCSSWLWCCSPSNWPPAAAGAWRAVNWSPRVQPPERCPRMPTAPVSSSSLRRPRSCSASAGQASRWCTWALRCCSPASCCGGWPPPGHPGATCMSSST